MRLAYYEPRFPFPQGASAGPYRKTLGNYELQFPFPQGGSAGPYPRLIVSPGQNGTLQGLGTYRPNQGFYRGVTPGVSRTVGFDFSSINFSDPTTLLLGGAAVYVLWTFLSGVKSQKQAVKRLRGRMKR